MVKIICKNCNSANDSENQYCVNCGKELTINVIKLDENENKNNNNAFIGAGIGAIAGTIVLGPLGAVIGGVAGSQVGKKYDSAENLQDDIHNATKNTVDWLKGASKNTFDWLNENNDNYLNQEDENLNEYSKNHTRISTDDESEIHFGENIDLDEKLRFNDEFDAGLNEKNKHLQDLGIFDKNDFK